MKELRYNHQLHHVLIALFWSVIINLSTGNVAFALLFMALWYTGRELWQFYYKKRTKTFDWGGCVPVIIAQLLAYLLTL